MAAFGLALTLGAGAPARAASATMSAATAPEGYTRITFAFDRAPEAQTRLVNGVLVVTFSEPVAFSAGSLAGDLGPLIGAIRRDPDGTALRMALNGPARLVPTAAGERFFVDLLPTSWKGLPPPLPADVIAELSREARRARDMEAQADRLKASPKAVLTVEGATHPTFRRLIFKLGGDAPVEYRRSGPAVAVTIGAPYLFDVAAARARLPLEFAGLEARRTDAGLVVMAPAPGTGAVRGFHEDGDFILDIDNQASPDAAGAHGAAEPAHGPAPASAQVAAKPAPEQPRPAAHADDHAAAAPAPAPRPANGEAPAAAPANVAAPSIRRVGETLRLAFPFTRRTPAAVFARGRTLWVVFDDAAPLKIDPFVAESGGAIVAVDSVAVERGQAARIRLAEPRLISVAAEGDDWVVSIGDDVMTRSGQVEFSPATDKAGRPAVQAELPGLGMVRSIPDPEVGDRLAVVTLSAPSRGLAALRQFVEFTALPTAQGLAIGLLAEDAKVAASIERITIERDGGLTLSPAQAAGGKAAGDDADDMVLNAADWAAEHAKPFIERESELMRGAALSSVEDRPMARLALAKFYQAQGRAADSAAVLGALVEDAGLSERDPRVAILRAAADVELGRPTSALAILSLSSLKMVPEAALWRAAAEEAAGRSDQARAALGDALGVIGKLPGELKTRFTALGVRLALDAGDAAKAEQLYHDLEVLPAIEGVGAREVLRARVEEAAGRPDKAAAAYAAVARRGDPASAAEAELRAVALGLKEKTLPEGEAVTRLERLVTGWRGDRVEAEGLARLIELYGAAGRWRDAFTTLRIAVETFPDADDTRALQTRMQERFTDLFLGEGVDKMPKLDALALFYDFKELLPGGKRGDELVRRLADKLVDVDLLDQAGELLTYQIENRLSGAARAQVASRAALIALMNGKPAKAIELLRKTRQADLPAALLKTRMRLEARALSETGRTDLALEIAAGLDAPDARRLKADILWSARRWPEAGEALEAQLGSSWRSPSPLEPGERADVMRAAIASALAGDGLAVDRIRQKYAPKMADSPEAASFEIVTAPIEARGDAFREVARSVAATSSFNAFLDEYRRGSAKSGDAKDASNGSPPKA